MKEIEITITNKDWEEVINPDDTQIAINKYQKLENELSK